MRCRNCDTIEGDAAAKLGRCKGCRRRYYCDDDCQRENWKDHKAACRIDRLAEDRQGREPRRWILVSVHLRLRNDRESDSVHFAQAHQHHIYLAMTQGLRLFDNYNMARTHCIVLDLERPPARRRYRRGRKPARLPYFVVSHIRVVPLDEALDEFGSCEQEGDEEPFSGVFQHRIDMMKATAAGDGEAICLAILRFIPDLDDTFFATVVDSLFPPRPWDEVKDWKERLFSLTPY